MKSNLTILLLLFSVVAIPAFSQTTEKKKQDREAILAMAGCYKVSFDFAETFSPDTAYQYYDRYHSWGIEYVFVLEDSEDLISLQHLLIINDSTIIKHWRQDWVFEEHVLLSYHKDNMWKKTTFEPSEVKGTWTQKVFQVDDSPRYESKGTWVHVDGRHYWEGTGDAPLPRREFTKRSDYNVMQRRSRMELAADGWFLEQDNAKILRTDSGDQLICHEKGMERFTAGDYDCAPAIAWWEDNKAYWENVRAAWDDVFEKHSELKLQKKVDDKMLWQQLFAAGDEARDSKNAAKQSELRKIIESYIEI